KLTQAGYAEWSTSASSAGVTLLLVAALTILYGSMLRNSTEIRISNEGIRSELTHFHEWENIHHVSVSGDEFALYIRVNPALPYSNFRLPDADSRRILMDYLSAKKIALTSG